MNLDLDGNITYNQIRNIYGTIIEFKKRLCVENKRMVVNISKN